MSTVARVGGSGCKRDGHFGLSILLYCTDTPTIIYSHTQPGDK